MKTCAYLLAAILLFPTILLGAEKFIVVDSEIDSKKLAMPASERNHLLAENLRLEREGRLLEKKGEYEEAIDKYREALEFYKQLYGSDRGGALNDVVRVRQKQHEYKEALTVLDSLCTSELDQGLSQHACADRELELNALVESENTGASEPLARHISYLKKKYNKDLPPENYWSYSSMITSNIIHLYDYIADYDAGMAFVDTILNYRRRNGLFNVEKLGGHARSEYQKIRNAFEQDKAEGRPSCITAKPGEVCMGRATKVLIQSDYFPW